MSRRMKALIKYSIKELRKNIYGNCEYQFKLNQNALVFGYKITRYVNNIESSILYGFSKESCVRNVHNSSVE